MKRRSRRPVEKYQIIHQYKGNKKYNLDFVPTDRNPSQSNKKSTPSNKKSPKPMITASPCSDDDNMKACSVELKSLETETICIPLPEDLQKMRHSTGGLPPDPLPDLLTDTTAQQRRRSSEDTAPLILTGRRKVCQTEFYQVSYPPPKRSKATESTQKSSKNRKSEGNTPSKGWRGKSNVIEVPKVPAKASSPVALETDDSKKSKEPTEDAENIRKVGTCMAIICCRSSVVSCNKSLQ